MKNSRDGHRVLLINPPSPKRTNAIRDLMGGFGMVLRSDLMMPPVNVAYAAAVLEEAGYDVKVRDAVACHQSRERLVASARQVAPRVVGVNTSSATVRADLQLAEEMQRVVTPWVFMLGSHVSMRPDFVFDSSRVDLVVRGEPEHTVVSLVDAVRRGTDLRGVRGLSFRRNGQVWHNEDRPLIEDLDTLPFPAYHLMPVARYRWPKLRRPALPLLATRGCPVLCSFCPYPVTEGAKWRSRSPGSVVNEIEHLSRNHRVRCVVFRDPVLTLSRRWAEELFDLLIERRLGVEWACETTLGSLSRDLVTKMKAAGCVAVSVGVESGNEGIRKRFAGNKIGSTSHAVDIIQHCRRVGVKTRAFFMIGFPEETPEMAEETIALALQLNPDSLQFTAVTPYPGTKMAPLLGDSEGERLLAGFTGYKALPVARQMAPEDVRGLIRAAYRRFYLRPRRLVREAADVVSFVRKARRYFVFDR